ncbi:MAG: hypothetical protein QNJ53_15120 [Pleurocapsa sp. MO_192.B19]|nr:hypothetical protein [Pleurocapsa sp. MO_192.B19]
MSVLVIGADERIQHAGDTFTLEVEVDPSFPEEEYEISWSLTKFPNHPLSNGRKTTIQIRQQHISIQFQINCFVTTNRDWHRLNNGSDDGLLFIIKVLPPI